MTAELRRCRGSDLEPATLYALLTLRISVFVVEQNCAYPELDGRDLMADTRHYWLREPGGQVVSTLRLAEECPDGRTLEFRIGRVCTTPSARGHGHVSRLLRAALAEVGDHPCRLSAQTYLSDMYARHGFVSAGEEFVEDGIPHLPMLRPSRR